MYVAILISGTVASAAPVCNELLKREQQYIQAQQTNNASTHTITMSCPSSKSYTRTTKIIHRLEGAPKNDVISKLNQIPVCAAKDENSSSANDVNIICGQCRNDETKICRPTFKRTACEEIEKGEIDPFHNCVMSSIEGEPIRFHCTRVDKAIITFIAACVDDVCDPNICGSISTNKY